MKRLLLLAAAPALLIAGCSSSTPTASAPAPSAPATTASSATTGTGDASPSTGSGSGSGGATKNTASGGGSSSGSGGGDDSRCHSTDLSVKLGAGGAAAGTQSVNLVFTNKSGSSCTLTGYPGVSWVAGDQGTQVNDPFTRDDSATKAAVTLKPGGVAHAVLLTPQYANYDKSTCKPTSVRGYRIYPPDETAAIFVSNTMTVCSGKGVGTGRVQPIATGPGEQG
jgi:hypothetical protein